MIRKLVARVLQAGLIDVSSAGEQNKVLVTTLFSLVHPVFLLTFGPAHLLGRRPAPALMLLSAAVMMCINYPSLYLTKKHFPTALFLILLTASLFMYPLMSGDTGDSGHLWFFIPPGLIYLVQDLKTGTLQAAHPNRNPL